MSGRARRRVALALAATWLAGCSWLGLDRPRMPDLPDLPEVRLPSLPDLGDDEAEAGSAASPATVEIVEGTTPEGEFLARATRFYERLTGRRFNSVTTFRDPSLREYFETEESYSEYFADLARDLADAHFERNRPVSARVDEFAVEGPGTARVRVRIAGDDGQPLRFWGTSLEREDRWERREGRWWIVPGAP